MRVLKEISVSTFEWYHLTDFWSETHLSILVQMFTHCHLFYLVQTAKLYLPSVCRNILQVSVWVTYNRQSWKMLQPYLLVFKRKLFRKFYHLFVTSLFWTSILFNKNLFKTYHQNSNSIEKLSQYQQIWKLEH